MVAVQLEDKEGVVCSWLSGMGEARSLAALSVYPT